MVVDTFVLFENFLLQSEHTFGMIASQRRSRLLQIENISPGGVSMQHKNADLMKQINTFIGEFYISHDRTPSTTEIAKMFGMSRSSAQRYLVAMNEQGMLSYEGGKLTVDKMEKLRTQRTQAPLVGSVPCGELTYEEENVECVMTLPRSSSGPARSICCMHREIPWKTKASRMVISWSSRWRKSRKKATW